MLCALQYDTVIVEVSIAFFVHCVITHHIAVILTCSSFQDSEDPDYFACAEYIGTIMLSLGTLLHERCDPLQAAAAYRQARRILGITCHRVLSLAALLSLRNWAAWWHAPGAQMNRKEQRPYLLMLVCYSNKDHWSRIVAHCVQNPRNIVRTSTVSGRC